MSLFPEEPLNLSAFDGFGYFPADINQALDNGRYTILRKLGWGPRSSTWLVQDTTEKRPDYWAVQIFTVAKSREVEERLLPTLQSTAFTRARDEFPNLRTSFWESSVHGEHLCLVISEYGLPFSDLLLDATNSGRVGLPVHVVKYTAFQALEVLGDLHHKKSLIMHSGIKLDNLAFWPDTYKNAVRIHIKDNPPGTTQIVDGLPVVRSQPLANYTVDLDDPMSEVVEWDLVVTGFGHIQLAPYTPESGYDYCSAPETLLENPTCGLSTDVWMLGCLVFHLLTGQPLFTSTGTAVERLAEVRDALHGISAIPDAWGGDRHVRALTNATPSRQSLEQRLKEALSEDEAPPALEFLRKCLAIEPTVRNSAYSLQLDKGTWVAEGGACSCGFH
ncbi:kinase-like domain-containing protein [Ephemerocybe angulata]|uniref:non-specific serine/threonine protein kinase n=1 Tax=Ephemerocybe angulata TaxID=980116 RepID=A0A8H6HCR9_9AGAR|nr:kinase-like domain-containing protein [Tulosesus angulatus]